MKLNNTQKIRQDNSCAVISSIFACKLREAIISVLTERAAPLRRSLNEISQRLTKVFPPFTISDWFRPRYEPNVCLLLNHRETFRVAETFFFFSRTAGRTSAPLGN